MNNNIRGGRDALTPEQREHRRREIIARERAKLRRKQKRADRICIWIAGVIFGVTVVINLFQFNRPTVSEVEKRSLASFPEFSFEALRDGDFTEGIGRFISDTFVFRDDLVGLARKLDTLKGVEYSVGGDTYKTLKGGENVDKDEELSGKVDDLLKESESVSETVSEPVEENVLTLSKTEVTVTVGGNIKLTATSHGGGDVTWTSADESVATVSADGNEVLVIAEAEGKTEITAMCGGETARCAVTVEGVTVKGKDDGNTAEFKPNGLFIYGDAVYTAPWYAEGNAETFLKVMAYYKKLFPNATVSTVVSPSSAICIDNEEVSSNYVDQKWMFDSFAALAPEGVNFVNVYDSMWAHRDEYIFFRTDHHWTARGAYYAYKAFVESVGLDPVQLDSMEAVTINSNYLGSMYGYTNDEKVKSFNDEITAYRNTKPLTMTVTMENGTTNVFDSTVIENSESYSAFIYGDNPYTVINVPDNPQDRNILVLKDSFGDAFIPFLAENYGNIYIVDVRKSGNNLYDMFGDQNIGDILFVNNFEQAQSPAWTTLYLGAVGS